jgi:hypothetical protein
MNPPELGPSPLTREERRVVRRVQRSCRASGNPRIDQVAVARLARAAARQRQHRLLAHLSWWRPTAQDCLDRLRSTLRHPSRTGVPAAPSGVSSGVSALGARRGTS